MTRAARAEFRALWSAEVASVAGDQLAKIALTVTVFERTGSPALSGLAYALTFVPPLITGSTLGWVADRFPRRTVLTSCCALQGLVVVAVVLLGTPLTALVIGAAAIAAVQPVFKSAQTAIVSDVLDQDASARARPTLFVLRESGMLLGLAAGGILVPGLLRWRAGRAASAPSA